MAGGVGAARRRLATLVAAVLLGVGTVAVSTPAVGDTGLGTAEPRVQQVAVDQAYVTWGAVAGAASYTVSLTPADGTAATYDTTGTTALLRLPATDPGTTYDVTVTTRSIDDAVAPTVSAPATMQVRPDRARIRFMQYNTCNDRCPHMRALSWRAPRIARQVERVGPDVLALEEGGVSEGRSHRHLRKALSAVGYAEAKGTGTTYIFYRRATISLRDYRGKNGYGRKADARHGRDGRNRPAPIRELRQISTNARVLVAAYHLTSLDRRGKDRARLSEYTHINKAIASARRAVPGVPVVKIGDFNSYTQASTRTYDSDSHRQRVWPQVRRDGFIDVQTVARATSNRSANTINQMAGDRRNFGPGRHLDHIFVERGTTSPRWALVDRRVSYRHQYSDHDPIWADLDLPAR